MAMTRNAASEHPITWQFHSDRDFAVRRPCRYDRDVSRDPVEVRDDLRNNVRRVYCMNHDDDVGWVQDVARCCETRKSKSFEFKRALTHLD